MSTTTSATSVIPAPSASAPMPVARTASSARRVNGKARIAIAIVLLGAGAVASARYLMPAAIGSSAEIFGATNRDFSVVLHEKGELKAAKSIDVKCEVEGRSTIIWLIPEGTEVKQGDLLVRLASQEIDDKIRSESIKEANAKAAAEAAEKEYEITVDEQASNVRKAELTVHNARIELDKYLKGDWEEQKTDAELEVKRAEEQLRRAKEKLEDSEDLFKKNFITQMELDDDRFAVFEAEIAIEKAKLKREILSTYTHPKDLGQKQSDLAEAEKELERARKSHDAKIAQSLANKQAKASEYEFTRQQLEKFQTQKSKTEIKAPAAGLVVYYSENSRWGNDSQIAEGREVYERQTIINLPDTTVMQVVVRIHEGKADKVKQGQLARVEVEGMPGQVFSGKVTRIAPLADSQNRWLNPDLKEYETEITLDGTHTQLKPAVTARAEIIVEHVANALVIPVQSVISRRGKRYAFVGKGDDPRPVEVALGRSNDQFVEVLGGLTAGDPVRLAVTEDHLKRLPDAGTHGQPDAAVENGATEAASPKAQPSSPRPRPEAGKSAGGGERRRRAPGGGERRAESGAERSTEAAAPTATSKPAGPG